MSDILNFVFAEKFSDEYFTACLDFDALKCRVIKHVYTYCKKYIVNTSSKSCNVFIREGKCIEIDRPIDRKTICDARDLI